MGRRRVPVDVPDTDSLRIRLHFVADAWRIDEVALAEHVEIVTPRRVPVAEAETSSPVAPPDLVRLVATPDEDYLITSPGTRFLVRFDTGPEPDREAAPSSSPRRGTTPSGFGATGSSLRPTARLPSHRLRCTPPCSGGAR